MFDNYL